MLSKSLKQKISNIFQVENEKIKIAFLDRDGVLNFSKINKHMLVL